MIRLTFDCGQNGVFCVELDNMGLVTRQFKYPKIVGKASCDGCFKGQAVGEIFDFLLEGGVVFSCTNAI